MRDLDKRCLLTYEQELKVKEIFEKIFSVFLIICVIWLFICLLVFVTGGAIYVIREIF